MKFKPTVCDHCHQTTNYNLTLSRGAATLLIATYNAVRRLDRNRIHFGNDMVRDIHDFNNMRDMVEGGWCTHKMNESSCTVLHRHGLIAATGDKEWLLTTKAVEFLRGAPILKTAVVDKTTGHQGGYWEDDGKVTLTQLLKTDQPWWVMPEAPQPEVVSTGNLFDIFPIA